MYTYQFHNEPLRILVAGLSAGLRQTDAFITSTLQKAMFREVGMFDAAVKEASEDGGGGRMRWVKGNGRWSVAAGGKGEDKDENEEDVGTSGKAGKQHDASGDGRPELPTVQNPVVVGIYG
jgi:general transcription factor 3C polypeptide 3 (transcription factor C subunit 4)